MVNKEAAGKAVTNRLKQIMTTTKYKKELEKLNTVLDKKHKLPLGISNDYVSLKKNPLDASIEIIYSIAEALDTIATRGTESIVSKFFSEEEIKEYKKYKYETKKITFPLAFEATQINNSQWIGKITVHQLMDISSLIRYNENTQRSLTKRTVNGDVEVYSITLNRKTLRRISELYMSNEYISNTITLNIPEDVDFSYENGKIIFKHLDYLDILDGYHRYVAMSNLYGADNSFNYDMEVRWVCFNEDKAKQFIWQEYQRTEMTKLDSDSLDQTNPGNQTINMLSQVTLLKGIIDRNGKINAGTASAFINLIWYTKQKQRHIYNRKEIVAVKKIIEKGMTDVIDLKPEAFDKPWTRTEIGALFICINHQDIENLFNFIKYINKEKIDIHYEIRNRDYSLLEEVYNKFKS